MSDKVKGFKATDKDGKCRGFQFEVGKTYKIEGEVSLCSNGFHFCQNLMDVYNYYEKSVDTRLFEIEALSPLTKDDKSCTSEITIIRELSDKERLDAWIKRNNSGSNNSGDYNSGDYNSGNYNSGSYSSGHYNSGNRNSGHYNSGSYNSGHCNSGHYNSGHHNSGHRNSGDYNSGDYNSGDYNSGNYNSGFFNTSTPFVTLFNKKTKLKWNDPIVTRLKNLNVMHILMWVPLDSMTEQQKIDNPSSKTTQGFLLNTGKVDWSRVSAEDLNFIKSLPNFDAEVFFEISGLRLDSKV